MSILKETGTRKIEEKCTVESCSALESWSATQNNWKSKVFFFGLLFYHRFQVVNAKTSSVPAGKRTKNKNTNRKRVG